MRYARYVDLFERAAACRQCRGVRPGSAIFGASNGPVDAAVMFVGEAPGRIGAGRTGVPFSGDESGRRFEALLGEAGLRRDDVFITNAVLCLPLDSRGRNRRPLASEVQRCRSYLAETIDLVRPQLVVALGRVALDSLGVLEPHGLSLRGHVACVVPWRGTMLGVLYHPGRQAELHRSREDQVADWRQLGESVRALAETGSARGRRINGRQ